jgi:hypothetical protein
MNEKFSCELYLSYIHDENKFRNINDDIHKNGSVNELRNINYDIHKNGSVNGCLPQGKEQSCILCFNPTYFMF